MDGNKFEEKWRAAVAEAEVQPSDSVWSTIESELITAENQTMKRQVVFYQRMAAALLIFALMMGAFGFYYGSNNENRVATSTPKQLRATKKLIQKEKSNKEKNLIADNNTQGTHVRLLRRKSVEKKMTSLNQESGNNSSELFRSESTRAVSLKTIVVESLKAPSLNATRADSTSQMNFENKQVAISTESPIKILQKKEESIELAGLTKTADENAILEKKPGKGRDHLWASLGMSAGNYNPGTISNHSSFATLGGNNSNSIPAVGTSYSVWFTVGQRVADRWVIQAGVNYLNQTSGSTSYISSSPSSANNVPHALDLYNASVKSVSSVTFTNPYQINSTLEFISIPVQAGYLLVDRKMGFQMNAGFATDFFVRNSLVDQSGQVNRYSQGSGSDSPYRTINWAGLVSSEFIYKVGRQYRISLVPGVRYLFNSTLKSGATNNSYVADIGFRFRYILR